MGLDKLTPRYWCASAITRRFACQAGTAQAVQKASVHTRVAQRKSSDRGFLHKLTPCQWCASANTRRFACQAGSVQVVQQTSVHTPGGSEKSTDAGAEREGLEPSCVSR